MFALLSGSSFLAMLRFDIVFVFDNTLVFDKVLFNVLLFKVLEEVAFDKVELLIDEERFWVEAGGDLCVEDLGVLCLDRACFL